MADNASITTEELHQFRKEIDALIKKAKASTNNILGREMALVHTKLQEAKMWAGKCLEAIGSELPKEFRDEAETGENTTRGETE